MTSYVLVPGMCHGGWCFDDVAAALRAHGHAVRALTLTSVGDPARPPDPTVDLGVHVDDVARALQDTADPAVLVGHSYGGVPLTVAADRHPGTVAALVYLDAFVPGDGDSCWSMTDDAQRAWYAEGEATGLVPSMPFFDPRASAHPLATLTEPARLTGAPLDVPRTYVYARNWGAQSSPFAPTLARLRDDPAWSVHELDSAHNLMRDAPTELLSVLLGAG